MSPSHQTDLTFVNLVLLIADMAFSTQKILWCFTFFFFYTTARPPTKTPCPESYPLIGNLPGFLRNRHRFHDWVTDMFTHTPSSTSLQVNSFLNLSHGICTENPINIEHLLATNFSNNIKGSCFVNVLYELLGHGIFNVDRATQDC